MRLKTIDWVKNKVILIDQTRLPAELRYLQIRDLKSMWQAIKLMKIRGAPALAAAAAFGVVLGIKKSRARNYPAFKKDLERVINYLRKSRPTAVNLFWGLERMLRAAEANRDKPVFKIKKILLDQAKAIIKEDMAVCRRMGKYGAGLIKQKDNILTICNAGLLATIDYGTALGVIYAGKEAGKIMRVFACETRPLLQGARLSAWELQRKGIDLTLICDSTAGSLMKEGKIDKIFVGADRIAANGDTANKIGTFTLALLAKYHRIPFYVVAPFSTFDLKIENGQKIPVEQRDQREVTELLFKRKIAPQKINVINPAFDVTSHQLISAIVTEYGIIRPPFKKNIKKILIKNRKK